jgi:hypothetical protein
MLVLFGAVQLVPVGDDHFCLMRSSSAEINRSRMATMLSPVSAYIKRNFRSVSFQIRMVVYSLLMSTFYYIAEIYASLKRPKQSKPLYPTAEAGGLYGLIRKRSLMIYRTG